jgi:alpha-methylacyl-CoA racemase
MLLAVGVLAAMMHGFRAAGQWSNNRGENMRGTDAHFYEVYTCADGRYVALKPSNPSSTRS